MPINWSMELPEYGAPVRDIFSAANAILIPLRDVMNSGLA